MMDISVYGAGYVGLVSAVCLAKLGHQVYCADISEARVKQLLSGECPIYENQLPALLKEQIAVGRLHFTADVSEVIKVSAVHLIAVGTPSLPDGNSDLSQLFALTAQIARESERNCLLLIKSTVPVGTGDKVETSLQSDLLSLNKSNVIDVISNPEFLREGNAVNDFLNTDRIILGGETRALQIGIEIYQPLIAQGAVLQCMSRCSSELTKYTANAMLACRISFMNQISQIANEVGADIDDIRLGISLDHRIGPYFLQAGIGYGGSCFPKDIRALIQTAESKKLDVTLLRAIDNVNHLQKKWAFSQLNKHFNHELQNLKIGIWGLAFKPDTDDMREASSLVLINDLLEAGATVCLYDPVAMPVAKMQLKNRETIMWCSSATDVLQRKLDALVIVTEWQEFKNYVLTQLREYLGVAPVIDGRLCYPLAEVKAANLAYYYSVGRPMVSKDSLNESH